MDTILGRMAEKQGGFAGIIPLLLDKHLVRGEIISGQGLTCDRFFILRTGTVQVHSELLYHEFTVKALGPSQWNVTRTTHTIQVADTQRIGKRGEIFGHSGLTQPVKVQKCYFTAVSESVDIYTVGASKFM